MQALLGAGGTKIPAQRRLLGCSFCWLSPVLAAWGRQVPVAICADLGLPWLPAIWQLHLQPSAHPPAQVTTAPCCDPTHLVGRGGPEAAPPAGGLPPPPPGLAPPPPTPVPPAWAFLPAPPRGSALQTALGAGRAAAPSFLGLEAARAAGVRSSCSAAGSSNI